MIYFGSWPKPSPSPAPPVTENHKQWPEKKTGQNKKKKKAEHVERLHPGRESTERMRNYVDSIEMMGGKIFRGNIMDFDDCKRYIDRYAKKRRNVWIVHQHGWN